MREKSWNVFHRLGNCVQFCHDNFIHILQSYLLAAELFAHVVLFIGILK